MNPTELSIIEARVMTAARNADTTRVALRRLMVAARRTGNPATKSEVVAMRQIYNRNVATLKDARAALNAAMRAKKETHR